MLTDDEYIFTFYVNKFVMGDDIGETEDNNEHLCYIYLSEGQLSFQVDDRIVTQWSTAQSSDSATDSTDTSSTGYTETHHIGISMPTQSSERWIRDGAAMKEILEHEGYEVELSYAEDNIITQKAQFENMINSGAEVLIVAAIDGSTLSDTLDMAAEQGIKIIAYVRLLVNTDAVSYYVTFDNIGAGRLQAESLIEGLQINKGYGPYNIELFAGSPDDTNSFYFFKGAMDVLQSYIDDGTVVIQSGQLTQEECGTLRWDGAIAKARMDAILAAKYSSGEKLDVVLSPYDGLSRGILSSLEAFGYIVDDIPIVTGQDAEAESIKLIITGEQYSTILKDTRELAIVAAEMAISVVSGLNPEVNATYDNNVKLVSTYILMPKVVTIENYRELVIDSGYLSEDDIQ